MASKKKNKATTNTANLPALKIGSRVRCTDDGVEGRIVWANAASVKIKWDDGEQVTWRRDALASKPIEIVDADDDEASAPPAAEGTNVPDAADQPAAPTTAVEPEETAATEQQEAGAETPPAPVVSAPADSAAPALLPALADAITWNVLDASPESETYLKVIGTVIAVTLGDAQAAAQARYATPHIVQAPEATVSEASAAEGTAAEQLASGTADATAQAPANPKRRRKAAAQPKEKKPSALDAAAKVLAEEGRPMTCKEMIGAMAIQGYWSSPGGKTPDATLYSALLREITTKGDQSRFVKSGPGHFTRRPSA